MPDYISHRLISPNIIKVVAGFLFANLATLLAATFKELLKPPAGKLWTRTRAILVVIGAALVIGFGIALAVWASFP